MPKTLTASTDPNIHAKSVVALATKTWEPANQAMTYQHSVAQAAAQRISNRYYSEIGNTSTKKLRQHLLNVATEEISSLLQKKGF